MKYEPLSKIYYKNPQEYEDIYQKRFNSDSSVQLLIKIGEYRAFYQVNEYILNIIYEISKIDKRINSLCEMLPAAALNRYARTCLINEVVLTNDIEGVHSSRREIGDIFDGLKSTVEKSRFLGLVNKYKLLMETSYIQIKTCKDIRDIYDDLVSEEIREDDSNNLPDGKLFRKDSVSVLSLAQKEIHRGLFPEEKVISTMELALDVLNDNTKNYLVRIALFHYLFGYIHPFYDGNGRVSRFISSSLLLNDLNPLISFQLSHTIKENISKYYASFTVCNNIHNRGDLTPFLITFLKIIQKSAEQLEDELAKLFKNLQHYQGILRANRDIIGLKNIPVFDILIQATLFSFDDQGITMAELRNHLDMSVNTIHKRLGDLSPYVISSKNGRMRYYKIDLEELEKLESSEELE